MRYRANFVMLLDVIFPVTFPNLSVFHGNPGIVRADITMMVVKVVTMAMVVVMAVFKVVTMVVVIVDLIRDRHIGDVTQVILQSASHNPGTVVGICFHFNGIWAILNLNYSKQRDCSSRSERPLLYT